MATSSRTVRTGQDFEFSTDPELPPKWSSQSSCCSWRHRRARSCCSWRRARCRIRTRPRTHCRAAGHTEQRTQDCVQHGITHLVRRLGGRHRVVHAAAPSPGVPGVLWHVARANSGQELHLLDSGHRDQAQVIHPQTNLPAATRPGHRSCLITRRPSTYHRGWPNPPIDS
jgi:hypothetical protein